MQDVGTRQPDCVALSAIWGNCCLSPRLPGKAEDISKSGLGGGGKQCLHKVTSKNDNPPEENPSPGKAPGDYTSGKMLPCPREASTSGFFLKSLGGNRTTC